MKRCLILLLIFLSSTVNADNILTVQSIMDVCEDPKFNITISSDHNLSLFQLKIFEEISSPNRPDFGEKRGTEFFKQENEFRNLPNIIEFFDWNSSYKNGSMIVDLINNSDPEGDIKPGYYNYYLIPFVQLKNNTVLNFDEMHRPIAFPSGIQDLTFKMDKEIIMGEKISINVDNVFSDPHNPIDVDVIYGDKTYYWEKMWLNQEYTSYDYHNESFPDFIDTILDDTQYNFYCPRDNLTLRFRNICRQIDFSIEQIPPQPSDIYEKVDLFFATSNSSVIPRIYYMAGAYFNCLNPESPEYL